MKPKEPLTACGPLEPDRALHGRQEPYKAIKAHSGPYQASPSGAVNGLIKDLKDLLKVPQGPKAPRDLLRVSYDPKELLKGIIRPSRGLYRTYKVLKELPRT